MQNKNKIIAIAAIMAIIVSVAAIYIWKEKDGGRDLTSIFSQLTGGGGGVTVTSNQLPVTNGHGLDGIDSGGEEVILPGTVLAHKYQNPDYGFSFEYPEGFNITEFEESDGYMILAQGVGEKNSFQIYITVYDEPGPLTTERIKKDLPKLVMENSQEIMLGGGGATPVVTAPAGSSGVDGGGGGVTAVVFFSKDESGASTGLGTSNKTREAWFAYPEDHSNGNNLFQVSSPAEFDAELSKIMATFKFN